MKFAVSALAVALAASSSFENHHVATAFTTPAAVRNHQAMAATHTPPTTALQMGFFEQLFGLEEKEEKKETAAAAKTPDSSETATTSFDKPTKAQVQGLFGLWNEALATLDSDTVARRYASDAVLLPTVSDTPRDSYDKIKNYFDAFLLKKPQGKILESHVTIGENGKWCQDNGIYEFTMGSDGSVVKARYSFFYVREGNAWKISHHHSSQMPEEVVALPAQDKLITEDEARKLFYLWNDALATGDPKVVAARYASNGAVLLPTVSDLPRTTSSTIQDYFVNFLKLAPQGKILESFVEIGPSGNWCSDSGIYEFTMGNDGDRKVKARYSFVYTLDEADGQWKIAHHHSSQMPEALSPKGTAEKNANPKVVVPEEKEIRKLFNLWNDALATGNPKKVAARYAKQAILLPTVSDTPRQSQEAITDYFVNFLKSKPQGVIKDGMTHAGDHWCEDCGVYEFTMGATGDKVLARYSFVYVLEDGEWKIAHHHSSMMPEPMLAAGPVDKGEILSESQVKEQFDRWNKALATKKPENVAALYATDALLLPTVSNVPRKTPAAITDYFTDFLKKEPQATLKDTVILTGPNYAEMAGVYDFVMGADGSEVSARFSFVYTKDEKSGEWKIAHHHSSAMPEGMFDAGNKYKMIEDVLFPADEKENKKAPAEKKKSKPVLAQ